MLVRIALMVGLIVGCASAVQAETFPYRAYIRADDVNVRSGPGDNYYPVAKLTRGDEIEVYRHDPGGWYAIRPPEGSYSWVLSEFIKPLEGNIGVVTGERVVARVSSGFSEIRDVIQVRLERGEEVEIIEAKRLEAGSTTQTWYKIAPPAGEFRWIAGKFVEQELSARPQREPSERNNLLLAKIGRDRLQENRSQEDRTDADDRASWQRTRSSSGRGDIGYVSQSRSGREDFRDEPPSKSHSGPSHHTKSHGGKTRMPRAAELLSQLEDIDLELANRVTDEPGAWDFRDLTLQTERVLARAETAVERGEARALLGRIARFDDIRERSLAMNPSSRSRNETAGLSERARALTPPRSPDDDRYDGVGKLAQVVASKAGAPQYALLDPAGQVRFYVTAAPGVNLRNYLGREIGVSGTLGYLPDQRSQHVTAKRITPLVAGGATLR